MDRKYNLKLDLQFKCNNSTMKFNQFDNNTSDFFMRITNAGKLVDIEKAIVVLAAIKPSGKVSSQFVEVENGLVYADLKNSMKDEIGTYTAQAMLILEDERVVTDVISYEVEEDKIFSLLNDNVEATEEFTLLTDMLSRLSTIEISEEQRMINEAERILSEENRKIEEAKRVEAELIRQHEEADRAKYDATRESNENIRKQNESIRLANETNRIDEEAKRVEEENKRKLAEEERNANYNFMTEDEERRRSEANIHKEAEVLRVQAETNRVNEEAKRRTTEQARVSAETNRVNNENTREANEETRQSNETKRVEAETQRQSRYNSFIADAEANANNFENYTNNAKVKEEERKSNELDRKSQEDRRVSNETERISNENTRKANEVARIESEKQRVDAENLRKEKIIEIQTDYDSLKKVIIDENASANLQNQINQTNSQLEQNMNYLKSEKMDKNGIVSMANMGQDVKEAMTGGSVAVVGKNAVGDINVIDGTLSKSKFNNNLIDKYVVDYIDLSAVTNTLGANIGRILIQDTVINQIGDIVLNIKTAKASEMTFALLIKDGLTFKVVDIKNVSLKVGENTLNTGLYSDGKNGYYVGAYITDSNINTLMYKTYSSKSYYRNTDTIDEININQEINTLELSDATLGIYFTVYALKSDIQNKSITNDKIEDKALDLTKINSNLISKNTFYSINFDNKTNAFGSNLNKILITNIPLELNGQIIANIKALKNSNLTLVLLQKNTDGYLIKDFNTFNVRIGINSINTGFFINDNNVYYVGVWIRESGVLCFSGYEGINYLTSIEDINELSKGVSITTSSRSNATFGINFDILNFNVETNLYSEYLNLKANFMGDSITAGTGTTKTYHEFLKESLGLSIARNYGIGGSRIADGSNPMYSRVLNMDDDADYIFVFGGTNDFNSATTLGTLYTENETSTEKIATSDTSTFYGALHTLCINLINKYPTKKIILMTPIHREVYSTQKTEFQKNSKGHYITEYVNAIKEVGEWYSIPVLDLYSTSGLNPNIPIHKELYFSETDGLHPKAEGHRVLADRIKAFLNTI